MVYIPKSQEGYSVQGAVARVPDRLKGLVGSSVHGLETHQVKQNLSFSIVDNAALAENLRGSLKSVLGSDHATKIVKGLTLEAFRSGLPKALAERMASADPDSLQALKESVHFSRKDIKETGLDAAERLNVRTALMFAFARGANPEELGRIREMLTSRDADFCDWMIKALTPDHASATQVLTHLAKTGTDPESARLIDWSDMNQKGHIGENFPVGFAIEAVVSKYLAAKPENARLDPVGATAVSIYSSQAYDVINKELRSGKPPSQGTAEVVKAAVDFMAKLPDFQGLVCRGGGSGWQTAAMQKYVVDTVVTEDSFTSSSPDCGFEGSIQFIIESRHGKEVSGLSICPGDGREVLFPPGTQFKVLAVERSWDRYIYKGNLPGAALEPQRNPGNEKTMFIVMQEVEPSKTPVTTTTPQTKTT